MLLKDSFTIHAPVDATWAMLDDVQAISQCVPGVEKIEELEENKYKGVLAVRVGPIGASFDGEVTFIERMPNERLVAEVEGRDRMTSTNVKATFTGTLSETDEGTTLTYEIDVALRGRLAQFGMAVVQATAKKMTADFGRCIEEKLSASEAG